MKNFLYTLSLLLMTSFLSTSCKEKKIKEKPKPLNYTVIIDLSDRILLPEQLDKDFYLIEKYFKIFKENSRRNLVLTSKNRFSVKIIRDQLFQCLALSFVNRGDPCVCNSFFDALLTEYFSIADCFEFF